LFFKKRGGAQKYYGVLASGSRRKKKLTRRNIFANRHKKNGKTLRIKPLMMRISRLTLFENPFDIPNNFYKVF